MNEPLDKPSLGERLFYYWRVVATGFSFGIFCLGGVVLSVMCFVTGLALPAKAQRARLMRGWLSRVFRVYLRMLRGLRLITFEIYHAERITPRGQLVIANHPTLLDVCFVISLIDEADCIVKESLWRWPLTAIPVRAADYLQNMSDGLIQRSLASLRTGASLVIFPEGTRSEPGGLRPFHRGAANIAIMAGKAITPVVITCRPATLLKSQRWYQISPTRPHYVIRVMPPIALADVISPDDLQSRAARKLNAHLEAYFAAAIRL